MSDALVETLKKEILEKGKINIDRCVILLCNGEQIIGELPEEEPLCIRSEGFTKIRNPKRVMRLQQIDKSSGSIVTNFVVGDYDLMEGGSLMVRAEAWTTFEMLSEAAQKNFVMLMKDVIANKMREKAAEAGLVTPPPSLVRPIR